MDYFNTTASLFCSVGVGKHLYSSVQCLYAYLYCYICMYVGLPIPFDALSAVLSYENYNGREYDYKLA